MSRRSLPAAGLLALASSFIVLIAAPGMASAAPAKPLPLNPAARSAKPTLRAELPDHRRSPGLKALLSEKDSDRGQEAPGLSALCQAGIGKPSPYRRTTPNVDQINHDAIAATPSQAGCSTPQNENTIAVNPENPKNLVAGTNDYRIYNAHEGRNDATGWAYTSFDGGASWKNIQLPHLTNATGGTGAFAQMDSAGDPVLAFGPHNTVYYGNIVFSRGLPTGSGTEAANGIALSVSHDGGLHWDEPALIQVDGATRSGTLVPSQFFNDKIWLAADQSSGRVYVTWTRFADNADASYLESPIVVAASTNYGRSFAPFRRVDTTLSAFKSGGLTPYSQGSNPQVGNDGTLYIAYEGEVCATVACDQVGVTDRDVTVVATSTDHGRTFTKRILGTNYDFPFYEPLGTSTLTGENFRVNSFPQLAHDSVTDALIVTWADDRNGTYDPVTGESIASNGDNIVAVSPNGTRWTTPIAIGTPQDEFFGAVAIHNGVAALTSYTRHYDPSGVKLDYAYWTSSGAMSRSLVMHRITTQSSDPRIQFVSTDDEGNTVQGVFIGDYTGVALGSDLKLHPNWTDFRGNPPATAPNQDAYTQSIQLR